MNFAILCFAVSLSGPLRLNGPADIGINIVTVTQIVTIPCFVETDPVISFLENKIGIHKADFGTHEWENLPLDVFNFNVSTQKEQLHLENAFITNIVFPNLVSGDTFTGDMLLAGSDLKNFSASNLVSYHSIDNQANLVLTNISLPALKTLFKLHHWTAVNLPSLSLPALTNCNTMDFHGNSSMTNFSAPVFVPPNGASLDFTNCALNVTSVNHILARCVANAAMVTGTVNLAGGTSAAPTGQGITDKNILIARGVTVFTN